MFWCGYASHILILWVYSLVRLFLHRINVLINMYFNQFSSDALFLAMTSRIVKLVGYWNQYHENEFVTYLLAVNFSN